MKADGILIAMYERRDEAAITETEQKYGAYCRAIANGILQDEHEASACLNEALLRTWNSIPPQKPQSLRLYLARIVRNIAFNQYKASHREKRGGYAVTLALDELAECVSGGDEPSASLEEKELAALISQFLYTIPERARAIFVSRYFSAMQTEAIAERYGMREGAVLKTLSRTRKKLREYLTDRGYFA